MVRSFAETLRRMASDALAASIFGNLFKGSGGSSGWISSLVQAFAGSYHDGGIVGQDGTMTAVNPLLFAGAPRRHNGTIPGLKSDEVPAILQRGEMVLSRSQLSGAGSQPVPQNVRIINAIDKDDIVNSLNSPLGEKIVVNTIRRNSTVVKNVLI